MDFDSLTTADIRTWTAANRRSRQDPIVNARFIDAYAVLASRGEPLFLYTPAELPGTAKVTDACLVHCTSDNLAGSNDDRVVSGNVNCNEPAYAVSR